LLIQFAAGFAMTILLQADSHRSLCFRGSMTAKLKHGNLAQFTAGSASMMPIMILLLLSKVRPTVVLEAP